MMVNGSLSKTAVNGSAGAKSQLSPLTAAVLTLVTLLFLTGIFEKLPEATLAAIVDRRRRRAGRHRLAAPAVAGANGSAGPHLPGDESSGLRRRDHGDARGADLRHPARTGHRDLPSRCSCCWPAPPGRTWRCSRRCEDRARADAGTAWVDTERHPDVQPVAGVLVVRVEASLVFSNAEYVRDRVRALVGEMDPVPRLVVLDGQDEPVDRRHRRGDAGAAASRPPAGRLGPGARRRHRTGAGRARIRRAGGRADDLRVHRGRTLGGATATCSRITGEPVRAGSSAEPVGVEIDSRGEHSWPR